MQKHHKEHGCCPDEGAFHLEVSAFCDGYAVGKPALVEEVKVVFREVMDFSRIVDDRSNGLTVKIISTIVQKCVHVPAMNELLNDALVRQKLSGLGQQIVELEAKIASTAGSTSVSGVSSFTEIETGDRVSMGIPWLDSRIGQGKGPVLGSVMGILAGQGTGKTSLGIQMGVAQALQQRHALLVLAEEGLSRTIKRRILACTTGIPTTELEAAKDDVQAAAEKHGNKTAVAERIAAMDKYLHVLDLVNGRGDLSRIFAEIDSLKMEGKHLTYVYVDWAGPIADRMMGAGYNGMQFTKRYDALKILASELAFNASRSNTIIAVSHQMAGAQFKKGAFAESDQYCAMDCSTFTEMFKYVVVINPKDPKTGISWLKLAKCRDDPAGVKILVRLRGELSQFYDVTNDYDVMGKNFKKKHGVKTDNIPKEGHA